MRSGEGILVIISAALLPVALFCSSCAEDVIGAQMLTAEGWGLFETGRFGRALAKFNEALRDDPDYADAYNGRGWSWLGLDSLQVAISEFERALTRGIRTADSFAGQAIAYRDHRYVEDHFELAVVSADSALARDPRYIFSHDMAFDWRDLRLIMAQSHYALSEYDQANTQIDSLGGVVQDSESEAFVEDLLAEIQRLGEMLAGQ